MCLLCMTYELRKCYVWRCCRIFTEDLSAGAIEIDTHDCPGLLNRVAALRHREIFTLRNGM